MTIRKKTDMQPPTSDADKLERLSRCANALVLAYMYYKPKQGPARWRHVEPYEIRVDYNQRKFIFFGWCHKDDSIERYDVSRILHVIPTDTPYKPRFERKML